MATKPVAWQEQGPVNSLNNESWAQGEVGATISHSSPLQDKKAPVVEPEDILEPGAQDETSQKQTFSRDEITAATKLEKQKSISLCTPSERGEFVPGLVPKKLVEAFQHQEVYEKAADQCEDVPPSPLLSALTIEECFEKVAFSSLVGAADEKIISDPTGMSPGSLNSQGRPQTPLLTEPVDQKVESPPEEIREDSVTAEDNDKQLHFSPDGFSYSEPENNTIEDAHYSPFDSNNTDDVYIVCSPPFVDESEKEEEVSTDTASCQQQRGSLDTTSKPFQSSYSLPVSTKPDPPATLPAVPADKHQVELLPESQYEHTPKGPNQEVAQQVHCPTSPPLLIITMELSSQGEAVSQGSGCVVAVRERHSRAGESTEGESEQTGGEEKQKENAVEKSKATGHQHCRGLLGYSQEVQIQELKGERYSKHSRMKSDLCDDTQSDSGVSTDFYPGSTLESNNIISTGTPTKETPIEREIRRAVERENSLRKSRGLPNPPTSPEYVEIPLKTAVLSQSFTAKSEGSQGKDRQFAGKMMYHEIHMETQREEDLVKLGKIPGLYDKGSVRQLKYKKQLFEAFQKPDDSTVSARSKSTSSYSANDTSALENREGISSQAPTVGDSHVENSQNTDVLNPKQNLSLVKRGGSTNLAPQGPGFSEATDCQVIILESNLSVPVQKLYAKQEAKPVTVVDSGNPNISSYRTGGHGGVTGSQPEQAEQDEEELTPKENPFFKLRSSVKKVKVEQDIRETQEREKELRKQRMSLYGCTGGAKGGGRPDSIEGKSLTLSSSSANGLAVLDSSDSSSTGGTGPSAARQSVGKLGVWPPAHAEEEKINQPQVHHCLQNSREKTPLVHQWESGLVNGHKEEDN